MFTNFYKNWFTKFIKIRDFPIFHWNTLPDQAVSAETVNTFKFRLDNLWSDQDVLYDYNADLHGIGNRTCSFIL